MEIQNGQYYSLGKKTYWLFVLQESAVAVVLLIIALLLIIVRVAFSIYLKSISGLNIDSIFFLIIGAIIFFAIVAEIIGFIVAKLKYGVSKIMVDDSSLKIVRGILSKEETAIPYRRIQSVEIKQPILYRLLGVGHVAISTTTDLEAPSSSIDNESDEEVVPVMDYELAKAITNTLTSRAETERMQVQK